MNFEHSDSIGQAKVRDQLSYQLVEWLKSNPPNEVLSQPPTESEFDVIKNLYHLEKSMDKKELEEKFVYMPSTL